MQLALGLGVDPNASAALDAGVLVTMLLVTRLAIYVVLRHKTRPR